MMIRRFKVKWWAMPTLLANPDYSAAPACGESGPRVTMTRMHEIPDDPGRRGAVAVCLRDDRRMLVIRRARSVVAPGAYCFPGGGIEPGESEEDALRREFREEINVAVHPICRIWRSRTPWKVDLAWWLGRLEPDVAPVPNPAEVESIHWLTADEMAALDELLPSNREFLELLAQGTIRLE